MITPKRIILAIFNNAIEVCMIGFRYVAMET